MTTDSQSNTYAPLRGTWLTLARVTWVILALCAVLLVVGSGPRVPCLPLIGPLSWDADRVTTVRAAVHAAVTRPDVADARAKLLIERFVPLDAADYASLLRLAPAA